MSEGRPDREDDRIRAAEYALGLLDEAEARAFEARLRDDPDLRAEYAAWSEHFAGLADGADVPPPAHVWQELESGLFGSTQAGPGRSRWRYWRGWGLGAALAAMLAVLLLYLGPFGTPTVPQADLVAYIEAESGDLRVLAGYDEATGQLEVSRVGGAPEPGRSFELWLIAGDAAPVSLGVLPERERGVLSVPDALGPQMAGATLAISDEPAGGSPTGQPTGAVLAAGQVITGS